MEEISSMDTGHSAAAPDRNNRGRTTALLNCSYSIIRSIYTIVWHVNTCINTCIQALSVYECIRVHHLGMLDRRIPD